MVLVVYIYASFITSKRRELIKNQMLVSINKKFKDSDIQHKFELLKIPITAKQYQIFRIITCLIIIIYGCFYQIKNSEIGLLTISLGAFFYILTGNRSFSLLRVYFRMAEKDIQSKIDRELISFVKLYQNNVLSKEKLKISAFAEKVATHYKYIDLHLQKLSIEITDLGIQDALLNFRNKFSSNHPFIEQIYLIILTTEQEGDKEKARNYLKSQQETITAIIRNIYNTKWSYIATICNTVSAIPTMLTIFMVIFLALQYAISLRTNY